MRGTHEFHENWAATKSTDSTVYIGYFHIFFYTASSPSKMAMTIKPMESKNGHIYPALLNTHLVCQRSNFIQTIANLRISHSILVQLRS